MKPSDAGSYPAGASVRPLRKDAMPSPPRALEVIAMFSKGWSNE